MINNLLFALTLVSALGCGLIAGVFFAFSVFVMKALASLAPAQGIAAMQSINLTVLDPWFLGTFSERLSAAFFWLLPRFLRGTNLAPLTCSLAACSISSGRCW